MICRTVYAAGAVYLNIAETCEESEELLLMILVLIRKIRDFCNDTLLIGIALIYKPHRLNAQTVLPVPREDPEILKST